MNDRDELEGVNTREPACGPANRIHSCMRFRRKTGSPGGGKIAPLNGRTSGVERAPPTAPEFVSQVFGPTERIHLLQSQRSHANECICKPENACAATSTKFALNAIACFIRPSISRSFGQWPGPMKSFTPCSAITPRFRLRFYQKSSNPLFPPPQIEPPSGFMTELSVSESVDSWIYATTFSGILAFNLWGKF